MRRSSGGHAGFCQALRQLRNQHHVGVEPALLFGEGIDQRLVEPQRLADIADGAFAAISHHHRRQRGAVMAVFVVDVLDHLLAPLVLEIDVDVRWLIAFAADETLEQQVGALGVDLGHIQAITDRRIGGRAAALAQDVLLARETHNVVHRQKVHLVLEFGDQLQFVFHLLLHLGRNTLGVTLAHAFVGMATQGLHGCATQAIQGGQMFAGFGQRSQRQSVGAMVIGRVQLQLRQRQQGRGGLR